MAWISQPTASIASTAANMNSTQTPTDLALLHELVTQLPSLCGELDGKIEAAMFPVMKRELAIWNNIISMVARQHVAQEGPAAALWISKGF